MARFLLTTAGNPGFFVKATIAMNTITVSSRYSSCSCEKLFIEYSLPENLKNQLKPLCQAFSKCSQRRYAGFVNVFLRFPIFLVQYYGDIVYKNRMVCIFESSTHENEKEVAKASSLWDTLKCMPVTAVLDLYVP